MKNILVVILFLIGVKTYSQKYELGKVTIDELKEKFHPKDTSAVAAVLFKKGNVFFQYTHEKGFYTITEVVEKIKIYKKDGVEHANQEFNFYDYGDAVETVEISDAFSYNLENNKIVKNKLKSDGYFEERFNKYWKAKKILFPQVKEGSIIEFKYKITSPRYSNLRDWNFQEFIPVNYSEYVTYIPEFFVYKYHQKGVFFPKIYAESFEDTYSGNYQGMENRIGGFVPVTYSYNIKHNVNVNKFSLNDLPSLKEEKFVNNINNYKSAMVFELSSVTMPGGMTTNYSANWEAIVNKIYENNDFGPELDKTGYFEKDILALVKDLKTRDEKVVAIFNYVKSTINWNGHKGYSCDDGVKTAYKNKTGNVAEINLMLTAMLRFAGIDASPILLSTRDNGIAFFPSRTAYNYVIAGVEIENDVILLDATDKFAVPNVLPIRDLNWFGRIIRKSGSSTDINLTPKILSKEITNMLYDVNSDGKVVGKVRVQNSDYNAFNFRTKYNSISEEKYLEELEKKLDNIEISEYTIENKTDLNNPIVETFSFVSNKHCEKIGDKIYLNPLIFYTLSVNPFKQDKRDYPVDFVYPDQEKYNVFVSLPEGYVVETLPAPLNLAFSGNEMTFKYSIVNTDNKLQLVVSFDTNQAILAPDTYEELKAFYNEVIKKQTEKIVLKKA